MSALSQPTLPQDYNDILQILPRLPEPDLKAATAALAGMADLSPASRAQRAWLARWQGRENPRLNHPRLSLFAANHGVAAWAQPQPTTLDLLAALADPAAPLGMAIAVVDADLRLYEMNLAQPTADFISGAAMTTKTCVQAMAYGMMAVEMGVDALALATCGDGQDIAAAVMIAVLLEQPLVDILSLLVLPLSFADTLAPVVKRCETMLPCLVLEQCGGYEIAALVGAVLASRMAHTPVIIADWAGLAALAVVHRLHPAAARHVALAGKLASVPWLPECLRIKPDSITPDAIANEGVGQAAVAALAVIKNVSN